MRASAHPPVWFPIISCCKSVILPTSVFSHHSITVFSCCPSQQSNVVREGVRNPSPLSQGTGLVQTATNMNIMLQARTPCITSKSLLPRRFKAFHLLFFQFAFSLHALSKLGLHFPNPRVIRLIFRSSILETRSHQQVDNYSQINTERYPTWRKDFFTILIIVSAYLSINASSPVAVTASTSSWHKHLYHITDKSFIHPNHTVITPSASPPSLDSS